MVPRDENPVADVVVALPWCQPQGGQLAPRETNAIRIRSRMLDATFAYQHDVRAVRTSAEAVVDIIGGDEKSGIREADCVDHQAIDRQAEERDEKYFA